MSADLQRLLDERAVERLFHAYFERIDANDPVGASAFMTADVGFEIMIGERRSGRDRFARGVGRVLDGYTATSHHVTNLLVDLDSDEVDEGSAVMYVYAFHRMAATGEPWHLWARVRDRVRREGDRWLICEHLVHGMDAVPMRHDIPRDWYTPHAGRLERA
jgi:ketosteroid isomerase-like protein